ncbi:MAG: DUF2442 domain-containing protein [Balneolaceae bacterium]|nr:DUF2442 domain-containing protein [Balneolaceae bacterium]
MNTIRVKSAEYLSEYKIKLLFSSDEESVIDFKDLITKGSVFEPLNDKKFFADFKLNDWTIFWKNGADFSPEFLYEIAFKKQTISS